MPIFERIKPDAMGVMTVPPGRYFIDTVEQDYVDILPELSKIIPRDSVLQVNDSKGRGFMMVSYRFDHPVVIPKPVYLRTGFFYVLPDDVTLNQASRELYGSTFRESQGFWDWLGAEHPDALGVALGAAEAVVETGQVVKEAGKAIAKSTGSILGTIVGIGVGVAALGVILHLSRKST